MLLVQESLNVKWNASKSREYFQWYVWRKLLQIDNLRKRFHRTAKNLERCSNATEKEEAGKFDPVALKGTFTKAPSQDESFKTKRLPGNIQNLKNAQELLRDQDAGSKNVYYIYHEEKSGSTKGPRWSLRVLYNCNVSLLSEKSFTFKC